jgi:hypothetical protein
VSEDVDPALLFKMLSRHLPPDLLPNAFIAGSLAAAYHFRDRLIGGVINTKDADVVVQPAGAITECQAIARRLLAEGWRRERRCIARKTPTPDPGIPADKWLNAVRLHPKQSDAYFLELIGLPEVGQTKPLYWAPCELDDGWYGLPCFRYMGLLAEGPESSIFGLSYASPAMMALANLLSHPTLEPHQTMGDLHYGRVIMRSAKDLGRVLALAWLTPLDELREWAPRWRQALRRRFPADQGALAQTVGLGLRRLVADADALEQARHSVDSGLLRGHGLGADQLRATAEQLEGLVIDTLLG